MEAAGFALSVFPAAVLAFDQFKKGAKYFKVWSHFRRQCENRIHDIEAQQLLFTELLFNLICCGRDPYLKQQAEDMTNFIRIVSDESWWKDLQLKRNLERRLGDSLYIHFSSSIKRVSELLNELWGEHLAINELAISDRNLNLWRYQWERIKKTLFSSEHEEKYDDAKRLIDDLLKILELHDKHPALYIVGDTSIATFFKTVQENALSLYKVLESSWHCHCDAAHKTLLLLERRLQERESKFCLIFPLTQVQLVVNSEPSSSRGPSGTARDIEKEVQIEILESLSEQDLDTAPITQSATTGLPDLDAPSVNVTESQASLQQNVPTRKLVTMFKLREFKATVVSKVRRREKSITSSASETRCQPGLDVSLITRQQEGSDPVPSGRPRVAFSREISVAESVLPKPLPISELCKAIQTSTTISCLGYLHDKTKMQYQLYLHSLHSPNGGISTITLKQLLEGDRRKFPRQKRLSVAANLASSLTQLQRTNWLNSQWGKEDIIFNKRGNSVIFEKPYVAAQFWSSPVDVSAVSDETRLADLNIHIKASLESLGIVLIELCLGEPIEKSGDKVRLRAHDDQSNHDFRLAIANAWTSEELRDEGPEFESPIDNCLRFPDIRRVRQGRYQEVLRDIYLSIAKPLHDEVIRSRSMDEASMSFESRTL